jgi:nucleoside-diphosphate-sugar epimerase
VINIIRIMIVGGAGFIGSFIARELVEKGYQPVIVDSFTQYLSPLLTMEYNKILRERFQGIEDKIIMERGNAANHGEIQRLILKHRPERIIHLAAMPISTISNVHIEEAIDGTIKSTMNIIDIAKEAGFIKRFVYTSSSMIYGDYKTDPVPEDHPKEPKDTYAGAKLAGEYITIGMCRRFGIPFTIVRPSAVYGPTDINRRVSQIFIENAILGKPLVLEGGGESKLDFTYVKDIAHGFVLATLEPGGENEIFNITTGKARTLKEYVEVLKQHFPNIEVIEKPADPHRPTRGTLDISKAREKLGYEPKHDLEKALPEYIAYLKEKIGKGEHTPKEYEPGNP